MKYLSEENIKEIVKKYGYAQEDVAEYNIKSASDKMLGFLADYWRLQIHVKNNKTDSKQILSFFIKAVSRSNEAKANMVIELNLFQNEVFFYAVLKKKLEINGLKPWSPEMVTVLNNDIVVFEDLAALQYKLRNKFERFDMAHTKQALNTLARFHAASIIVEENNSKQQRQSYRLYDEFNNQFLEEKGYIKSNSWFQQCMKGALKAVRAFSKYSNNEKQLKMIERDWEDIWFSALDSCEYSNKYRNVTCHRDLWNNNFMFHYIKVDGRSEPDDCLLVDFQGVRFQTPASDVMLLLYCNLEPQFRKDNLNSFLNYYYNELSVNLEKHGIDIKEILNKEDFLNSAEESKRWGLIVCACLIQVFMIDDELVTKTFSDTDQFQHILTENKGEFIKKMMSTNLEYRQNVMEIFEEIIEAFII